MAKRRSDRLTIVLTLIEREAEAISVRMNQMTQQLHHQQQQLAQLKSYVCDYVQRIDGQQYREGKQRVENQRRGLQTMQAIAYRQFLLQLSNAETSQVETVALVQRQLDELKRLWREKYQRKKAVENMIERMRYAENREIDKREQREMDELTLRYIPSNTPSGSPSGLG